jgi:glycosyltransferase involved in cell wall biosynthesis
MYLKKHALTISTLLLLLLTIITIIISIQNTKRNSFLKKQIKFNVSQINTYKKLIPDILLPYEESLSNITQDDYANARKLPNDSEKTKFCIIISSYNNVSYVSQNLNSIFKQNYHNWRIKYFDDKSNDGMSEIISKIKQESKLPDTKLLIHTHTERLRSVAYNLYDSAHNFCTDDEVMVTIDGDDMLASNYVLKKLSNLYSNNKIWMTYGSFMHFPSGNDDGCCNNEVSSQDWPNIRLLPWSTSHLRTSYTWLFKKINVEDLKYEGEFVHAACDVAIMYPMLEMAGKDRVKFIKDILYLYRIHPKNDHFIFSKEQTAVEKHIKKSKSYNLLKKSSIKTEKLF